MAPADPDTETLLQRVADGDRSARNALLERHRSRLRRMIAWRLDRRLAARVDPSDVLQEALADAAGKLDEYVRRRPLPFYPWLRQIAWNRLTDLYRRHVRAGRRSVTREEPAALGLPADSAHELAERLLVSAASPSEALGRASRATRTA